MRVTNKRFPIPQSLDKGLRSVVESKRDKTFSGMLILIFVFACVYTVAICSFDFTGSAHAEDNHQAYSHCGADLNNFVPSEHGNSSFVDLTSYRSFLPPTVELYLPILNFSIFKVPKPA